MPPENLLEWIRQRPFVPFRVCLTDGASYEVRHPELIMPGKRAVVVGLPGNPSDPLFERTVTVALSQVVRLEPIDSAAGQVA
jgi:hypothetical protein